jgi:hypothetical protein
MTPEQIALANQILERAIRIKDDVIIALAKKLLGLPVAHYR